MHILINGWFFGQSTTGSGQYLHHLLTYLPHAAPTARLTLVTPERAAAHGGTTDWPGVDVAVRGLPPLPLQLSKVWWEQIALPMMARRLQADVLWVPYWAAPFWQPLPVVVTVHDLIPRLLPAYRGGLAQRLYTGLVSITARRAQAVVTVSQASARDIVLHLGIAPAWVHVVYHGPNRSTTDFDPAILEALRRRLALPDRFFLYLGGFDTRKNVHAVLQAYHRFLARGGDPAIGLVVAGSLPDHDTPFAPDPRQIAGELGLRDRVRFCGWVDDGEKPLLYHMAIGYLFPSLYEGFGMTVLEAMSAGTPVITSAN